MLHKRVHRIPPKRHRQLSRTDRVLAVLQIMKDALQGERDVFGDVLALEWDLVDGLAEDAGEEPGLEDRVHVAGGALVLEADVAGHLLRVVAEGRELETEVKVEKTWKDVQTQRQSHS